MGYNGYTEKKKLSNKRYIENNDMVQLKITLKSSKKAEIMSAASASGCSATKYILDAVQERMEREGMA